MPDLDAIFLDIFPEAAVLVHQGRIVASNAMARHYLPQLKVDAPLPGCMIPLQDEADASGSFFAVGSNYTFTRSHLPQGLLILFRPAPQTALTDTQLEGALRQMRQFMGEFLMELNQDASPQLQDDFHKSYYRMFRLVENLDLVRAASTPQGLPFSPTVVDLVALCRQVTAQAGAVLALSDITLTFKTVRASLLILGDPQLLQRLLLELISNSSRAVKKGAISIFLHSQDARVLLSVSDSGGVPSPHQISAMFQQASDCHIPEPGVGAGLGLSIVRHIVQLHSGTMLVQWGEGAPSTLVALPIGPLDPHVSVQTPRVQRDGGLSPLLVALSDVLPAKLLAMDGLD